MTAIIAPVRGQIYTVTEMFALSLKDAPYLMFDRPGKREENLQTSHLRDAEVLEALAGTTWRYIRTTNEWCPLFVYTGQPDDLPVEEVTDDRGDTAHVPRGTGGIWKL